MCNLIPVSMLNPGLFDLFDPLSQSLLIQGWGGGTLLCACWMWKEYASLLPCNILPIAVSIPGVRIIHYKPPQKAFKVGDDKQYMIFIQHIKLGF